METFGMTAWTKGRFAVAFTFDVDAEEVWIADDPANADRPGVSPRARTKRRSG
jgi:hypothetical protein